MLPRLAASRIPTERSEGAAGTARVAAKRPTERSEGAAGTARVAAKRPTERSEGARRAAAVVAEQPKPDRAQRWRSGHSPRCREAAESRIPASQSGFTLLELLVVLSILGLVSALAAPPLLRTVQAWQQQSDIDSVMEQVRGLPMRARALGRTVVIDDAALSAETPALTTPEGWSLSATRPWQVNGNGVCQPGELMLARDDRRVPILVHAPFCQPRRPALEP